MCGNTFSKKCAGRGDTRTAWRGGYSFVPAANGTVKFCAVGNDIAIIWFDDSAALRAATATPEWERTKADDANFLAPGPVSFIITTEHVIIG